LTRRDEVKDFHDLIKDVQAPGLCGRCGGCVSFCAAGELHALHFGKDGTPEFENEEKCLHCGICYLVCPQVKVLGDELKKKFNWKRPVGSYRELRSAKTTKRKVAAAATDGGVVTSILLYALEKNLIDGALVARRTGPFSREPAVVTTAAEIIDAAGSHYDDVAHLGEAGRRYTSFVPEIREVSKLRERGLRKVAFVGTPCQVYSLRKMQALKVVPSDTIALVIGLFCMENFSFTGKARRKLEKKLGLKLDNVTKLNIKDDVIMTVGAGAAVHVPFSVVDEIARPACFACPDFANDFADISCGGLGSPDGYTTAMVRTALGERTYNGARRSGFIAEMKFRNREESVLHRTTTMAKIVSFALRKQERAARVLEN
jgi:coenzyme F420 hydrogenase subunit beta